MQAIRTQYFGPSNVKGSRIKATCAARAKTFSYNHALSLHANHVSAAGRLRDTLGWNEDYYGTLATGTLADGSFVHVLTGRDGKGDI